MNAAFFVSVALLGALVSGNVLASDDCVDPVADWQPREVLRQQVAQYGWTVQRIKVDDGCYEVRGIDRWGNRFEAKFAPATLSIRTLEIDFRPDGDAAEYLQSSQ
jgi:hypothetical protein